MAIVVSGGHLYIAGTKNSSDIDIPCYWVDGTRTDLSVLDVTINCTSDAIAVSGSDFFVAGDTGSSSVDSPCVWTASGRTDPPLPAGWSAGSAVRGRSLPPSSRDGPENNRV
jgi:hypothetical protein